MMSLNLQINATSNRDRLITITALVAVFVLCWGYLFQMDMTPPPQAMSPEVASLWSPGYFFIMFVMWLLMMFGMMIPSAIPMILAYLALRKSKHPHHDTLLFSIGYLAIWGGFSLIATALQWALNSLGLLSPMMTSTSSLLGALLLVGAGLYQFTPLKQQCLENCRSPFNFLLSGMRTHPEKPFRLGISHGGYCLGCCWAVMMLLFVGGVMNFIWIALLTLFVLMEKVAPWGEKSRNITGALMVLAGLIFGLIY